MNTKNALHELEAIHQKLKAGASGATPRQVEALEEAIRHFRNRLEGFKIASQLRASMRRKQRCK